MHRIAQLFPRSFTLGIDVLVRPDFTRHTVLEINAFGDLLLNQFDRGEDAYTATLAAWLRGSTTAHTGSDVMNMNEVVGRDDVLLMTFDTLRYDAAQESWRIGRTPNLERLLPVEGWERRHSPGNFTYAAHAAFFAGFFPTPAAPAATRAASR